MDRHESNRPDGEALHRLVADRVAQRARPADWRMARDLALVLTGTTAGPLAPGAPRVGASPAAAWVLAVVTAAGVVGMAAVLRAAPAATPADVRLALAFAAGAVPEVSSRWRTAALRLVPARHRLGRTTGRHSASGAIKAESRRRSRPPGFDAGP